jgi:hypothetical protein
VRVITTRLSSRANRVARQSDPNSRKNFRKTISGCFNHCHMRCEIGSDIVQTPLILSTASLLCKLARKGSSALAFSTLTRFLTNVTFPDHAAAYALHGDCP